MKKLYLTATLAAITACTLNVHITAMSSLQRIAIRQALKNDLFGTAPAEAFESEKALAQFFYDTLGIKDIIGILPEIARAAYLAVEQDASRMPEWLVSYLGFSIQDLIDDNALPSALHGKLDLRFKHINDLTGIQNIPDIAEISDLDLSANSITAILPKAFIGMNKLVKLNLFANKIATIAPNAFMGLDNLTELDLSLNKITTIAPDTFIGLENLISLKLNHNQIKTIAPNTFTALGKLTNLHLLNNPIMNIAPGAFTGLDELKILNLEDNPISAPEKARIKTEVGDAQIFWLRSDDLDGASIIDAPSF